MPEPVLEPVSEPAPEPVLQPAPGPAPEPPAAAPDSKPVFAGVAGFNFQAPPSGPSSVGGPPPSPEASGDEIQPAPPALAEDVPEPEQVFGPEFGRAPAAGPGPEEATGGPTLIMGPGELDRAAATEATPAEGTVLEPPESVEAAATPMPDPVPSTKPAKPKAGSGRRTTAVAVPRSKTAAVRKRGRKALEALDALSPGGGATKSKSRRSRRIPLKGRSVTRKILLAFVVLVLLGVGGLAAVVFVPEHLVPEGFRDRLDSLKSTLRELGLPIALPPPGGRAPGVPARGGGSGETGGGTDAGPEEPDEATGPLPIEK